MLNGKKTVDSKNEDKIKLYSKSSIFPRTRDYICPNKSCKAHDKNYTDREAIFFRKNKSYELEYLCCICNTIWDN